MTTTKEVVFTYRVSFVSNDGSVNIEITEDTGDIPHEAMVVRAEDLLKELWGVQAVPSSYNIVNVEVYEDIL